MDTNPIVLLVDAKKHAYIPMNNAPQLQPDFRFESVSSSHEEVLSD